MKLVKVLNTSVVLALNQEGQEIIVMGKGIGFRKAIGDSINLRSEDKVFVLKNNDLSMNIIKLATITDADVFTITKDLIDYAIEKYQMQLMDSIYLALTDHLAFAIQRSKIGMDLHGIYSMEVKLYYPKEYELGSRALKLIDSEMGIQLPENEISNIAFHFINAQKDSVHSNETKIIRSIVKDVRTILMYHFKIQYNEDGIAYTRFMTHIQSMAQRIVQDKQLEEDPMFHIFKGLSKELQMELVCVDKIADFLNNSLHKQMTSYEKMYLAIHIKRILDDQNYYDSEKDMLLS